MNECVAFPGQGVQKAGMVKSPQARDAQKWFALASNLLGYDLGDLCKHGPDEQLTETRFAQPAIMVTCYAMYQSMREMVFPEVFLGHSLGEVTAMVVAGAVSFEDGVRIVAKRGELMNNVPGERSGMSAILGLDSECVQDICAAVRESAYVEVANNNAPGQIVVSGTLKGLKMVEKNAQEKGARRVVPLNVSGAFHSKLMGGASEQFKLFLEDIAFQNTTTPVISNIDSRLIQEASEFKQELVRQLTEPVDWVGNIEKLGTLGVSRFVEIGPTPVLNSLVKRISKNMTLIFKGTVD